MGLLDGLFGNPFQSFGGLLAGAEVASQIADDPASAGAVSTSGGLLSLVQSVTGLDLTAAIAPVTSLVSGIPVVGPIVAPILGGILGTGGAVNTTGFSGGNGRFATRTIVETMDTTSGKIVKRKTLPGSPYLMNSEVAGLRKVVKKSNNLQKRIPRRTVKQSTTSKLTEAVQMKAIQNVQLPHHGDHCP